MGNKLEKCNIICCYKNTKEYNMDGKNNVIYINPNQSEFNKFETLLFLLLIEIDFTIFLLFSIIKPPAFTNEDIVFLFYY